MFASRSAILIFGFELVIGLTPAMTSSGVTYYWINSMSRKYSGSKRGFSA